MPKATKRLSYAEPKHVTVRSSVPKKFVEMIGATEGDSLIWEWEDGGKEAKVRKVE